MPAHFTSLSNITIINFDENRCYFSISKNNALFSWKNFWTVPDERETIVLSYWGFLSQLAEVAWVRYYSNLSRIAQESLVIGLQLVRLLFVFSSSILKTKLNYFKRDLSKQAQEKKILQYSTLVENQLRGKSLMKIFE